MDRRAPLLIGVAAIAAQLALVLAYYGAFLVVPGPLIFVFGAVWGIGLTLVIFLASRRSWGALLIPTVWLVAFVVVMLIGDRILGWRP
jgi:hypothetical protein